MTLLMGKTTLDLHIFISLVSPTDENIIWKNYGDKSEVLASSFKFLYLFHIENNHLNHCYRLLLMIINCRINNLYTIYYCLRSDSLSSISRMAISAYVASHNENWKHENTFIKCTRCVRLYSSIKTYTDGKPPGSKKKTTIHHPSAKK